MPNLGMGRLKVLDSVTSTKQTVNVGSITIVAIRGINPTGAAAHLQLFNKLAADVTVGTTIPDWTVSAATVYSSDGDGLPNGGIVFDVGLVVASTTTPTGSSSATTHWRLGII